MREVRGCPNSPVSVYFEGKVSYFSLGAGRQSRYTSNCLFDDEGLSAFLNVGCRDVVF